MNRVIAERLRYPTCSRNWASVCLGMIQDCYNLTALIFDFPQILNLTKVLAVQDGCTLPRWECVIRGNNQWDM